MSNVHDSIHHYERADVWVVRLHNENGDIFQLTTEEMYELWSMLGTWYEIEYYPTHKKVRCEG